MAPRVRRKSLDCPLSGSHRLVEVSPGFVGFRQQQPARPSRGLEADRCLELGGGLGRKASLDEQAAQPLAKLSVILPEGH